LSHAAAVRLPATLGRTRTMTPGFAVVLSIAVVLVVVPSLALARSAWHFNLAARTLVVIAVVLLLMALIAIYAGDTAKWPHSLEEKTVIALAVYAIVLGASGVAVAAIWAVAGLRRPVAKLRLGKEQSQ
jgi:hypothetical protein